MALGRSNRNSDQSHPGEPGIGVDLAPPFVAADDSTRWLFSLNRMGIRPGLSRIEGLLADLGNPEKDLKTLVIAGTNGKGSTTRILANLLSAAGHSVAVYTSPHLLNVHERILINDKPVDPLDFAQRVEAIKPSVEKHQASWFETLTALAVQIAFDAGVDYFCCETGLGGRLDASNAIPSIATLLTTVAIDHQHILGETRQEILLEKLGLLKPGVPLFCAVDTELRPQTFKTAVTSGCPCFFLDEIASWEDTVNTQTNSWDLILRQNVVAGLPDPGTVNMRRNIALAVLTLDELAKKHKKDLLPTDIPAALGNLFLPGRYQTVLKNPNWIFDTAHNEQALTAVLCEFADRKTTGRKIVLFGAMHDKGMPAEVGVLLNRYDVVVGAVVSLPRSRTEVELAELLSSWGLIPAPWKTSDDGELPRVLVAPNIRQAIVRLAAALQPEDNVLVTGSCFTVAETFYQLGFDQLEKTREIKAAQVVFEQLEEQS